MTQLQQRSWARFGASLGALALVVIGIPAFLIACSRLSLNSAQPLPGIGSVDEIQTWMTRELSVGEMVPILLRSLLVVGWVLWALLLSSVLAAVVTSRPRFSHWPLPSLPVFDGFAGWVAVGLTALSTFAPATTAFANDGPPVPQSVYATLVVDDAEAVDVAGSDVVPDGYAQVQTGESIQKVAQRTLGDADRWPELWALRDAQLDDGSASNWTQPWRIEAGWLLKLPITTTLSAPAASFAPVESAGSPTTAVAARASMTVRADGSYWQLATDIVDSDATVGDIAALTKALRAHNAPRLGYDDPNLLHPGDVVYTDVAAPGTDTAEMPAGAVVVEPGGSYWNISVDTLAAETGEIPSVEATHELTEALVALNAPRFGYDDPTMLHPGDIVHTTLDEPAAPGPTPGTAEPAEPVVEEAPPVEAPTDVVAEATDTTPSEPGVDETSVAAPKPVPAADVVATTTPATEIPQRLPAPTASEQRSESPAPNEDEQQRPIGAVLAGLTALAAAGLGLRIASRRAKARRMCRPGERPAPVPQAAVEELAAVAYREVSDVTWMSLELRWLAHQLIAEARSEMTVQLVQLNADRTLEVAFMQPPPCTPPDGWAVAADRVWTLPLAHAAGELDAFLDVPPVLPSLVTVGDATNGGQVYLNTEATSGLNVVGDEDGVSNWIRNAVWEIAGAALAERPTIRVVCSDLGDGLLDAGDVVAAEASDVFDELSEVFADGDVRVHRSMLSLRTNEWEAWPPTVVIAGKIDDTDADRWELVADAPWVACFASGELFADGLSINIRDGVIAVPAFGLELPAAQLSAHEASVMSDVLASVAADPVIDEVTVAVPEPAVGSELPEVREVLSLTFHSDDWQAPEWPVLVRVFGEPDVLIDGEVANLTPQRTAILALLAIEREVSIEDLKRAIWPPKRVNKIDPDTGDVVMLSSGQPQMIEQEVTKHRVRDALSELRKAVGGVRVVSNVSDGKVSAGPDLGCDTMLFDALNARAGQDPASTAVRLHEMLLLVRGPVFGYAASSTPHWRWVDLAQLEATWEGRVVTAAHTLSGMYLAHGDAGGAREIAERGLAADPLNSALTERLMEAYAQLGAVDSAQRVYEAHDRAMIDFGGATPETRMVLDRIRAATHHSGDDHIAQSSA